MTTGITVPAIYGFPAIASIRDLGHLHCITWKVESKLREAAAGFEHCPMTRSCLASTRYYLRVRDATTLNAAAISSAIMMLVRVAWLPVEVTNNCMIHAYA